MKGQQRLVNGRRMKLSIFEFRQIECLITCKDKMPKMDLSSQDISFDQSRGRNEFELLMVARERWQLLYLMV